MLVITLKYFGMLVEQTHTHTEKIELAANKISMNDLELQILTKYPKLSTLTYNIALNQKIVAKEALISNGDEIAFLPPFAGG